MKIYTNTFDLAKPTPKQFEIPAYSDFGIGIKVLSNGEETEAEVTLEADGQEMTAEADKVAGFYIYNTASEGTGSVKYKVTCNGQSFDLTQIVADTSVFEKKTSDVITEYVVAIGSIVGGVLSRSSLSNVVEVDDYALKGAFASNDNIKTVGFQNMTTIGESGMLSAFSSCSALTTVDMSKLSSVGTNGLDATFKGCTSLEIVLFQSSTAVPAITETTFANTNDTYKVIVPDALYEDWIAADNWTSISAHVTKVSDYAAVMTNYGGQDRIDD